MPLWTIRTIRKDNAISLLVLDRLFDKFRTLAVPVFMLISFFFAANWLTRGGISELYRRIRRIYMPLLIWAVIYLIVFKLLTIGGIQGFNVSLSRFCWQIITGHSLNPPMWFNSALLVLTFFYFFIYKFCANYVNLIHISLIVVSMGLEYLGINALIFKDLRFELAYPLGRIVEMIPFASIGLLLYPVLTKSTDRRLHFFVIIAIMLVVVSRCNTLELPVNRSFDYGGVNLLLMALGVTCLFYVLHFEAFPHWVSLVVGKISQFNMGVYCMHLLVGKILLLFDLPFSPFVFCLILYVTCLLLSFIISLIPIPSIQRIVV